MDAKETINETQHQVTYSMNPHCYAALQASVDCQQHRQHDDEGEASVQGGGDAHTPDAHDRHAGQAGGHVNGGHGGGYTSAHRRVHCRCDDADFAQPVHRDEGGLGKPKFTIPKFVGSTDVEEYLNWELKVEELWHMHEYTEDRKNKVSIF
jgi:hypothetical protein